MKANKFLVLIFLFLSTFVCGQVVQPLGYLDYSLPHQINIGNGVLHSTHPSASLEIDGTTRGFLPPRLTTTQRNAIVSPALYLTIINTNTQHWNIWNGTSWIDVGISDSVHVYAEDPMHARNDSTLYMDSATATTNGYLYASDWRKFNKNVGNIYVHSGDGVDTVLYDTGDSVGLVAYLADVQSDGWIVVPSVNYSGTPGVYNIGLGIGRINSQRYVFQPTQATLTPQDSSFGRTDIFVSDTTSHSYVVTGTPAADPAKPTAIAGFQLEITHLDIPAVGGSISLDTFYVYKEHIVPPEFEGSTVGTTMNLNNTTAGTVWQGAKSANITNIRNGNQFSWTQATPIDISQYTAVGGYIKLKGTIPNAASLRIQFVNGSTVVGNFVTLVFAKTLNNIYQPWGVQVASFNITTTLVTGIRFTYVSNNNTVNTGFYIDNIYLQNGIPATSSPADTSGRWVNNIGSNASMDSIVYFIGGTRHVFKFKSSAGIDSVLALAQQFSDDRFIDANTHSFEVDNANNIFFNGSIVALLGPGNNPQIGFGSGQIYMQYADADHTAEFVMEPSGTEWSNAHLGSHQSGIRTYGDSILISPYLGYLKIASLTSAPGTAALRYNPTTGFVSYGDTSSGGGGGGSALSNGKFWVGNGSNVATAVTPTGDVTFDNTGAFTIGANKVLNSMVNSLAWSKLTSTPTTLLGYGITDAQPLDADLTTIAGLTETTDNMIVGVSSAWASRTPTQVKTTLALNNVENTALSTWAGSSNITTLGTIATGVWNGTAITNSFINSLAWSKLTSTPTTLLGYGITDAQPLDADLTTIAGLTATTDNMIVGVSSAWASRTPTQVKTTLALNNVENTALSTWAGSSNITTLGTIATGVWNGTAITNAFINSVAWGKITSTPTTLSGYGIIDAISTSRTISTTAPLSGGGDLSADRTLSIADAIADGATKGAAAFTAADFNSASGVISLDYTNGQKASSSVPGFATSNQIIGTIGITVDGQGGVVSTGSKGFVTIPYDCTITKWYVSSDVSGSIQFDLKRSGTSIIGGSGNKPLLSSASSGNATPTTWTSTSVTAGDILEWNVDSATTITNATVVLKVVK